MSLDDIPKIVKGFVGEHLPAKISKILVSHAQVASVSAILGGGFSICRLFCNSCYHRNSGLAYVY